MRVSILVSSFIVSLLFVMAIGKSSFARNDNGNGPNCQDLLLAEVGTVPECTDGEVPECEFECTAFKAFQDRPVIEEDWTLEFFISDNGALNAAIVRPETEGPDILGCQCKATGSFTNPKFDTSNWFHCAGELEPEHGIGDRNDFSIEGQVVANGNTIHHGEGVSSFSRSWVYECSFDQCECEEF